MLRLLVLFCFALAVAGQPPRAARSWRTANERAIIDEYFALLAKPNVAQDAAGLRANAKSIAAMYRRRGVRTRLLEAAGAAPVVYGEISTPGATRSMIFYAHYDGQPVERERWATGDPFRPMLYSASLEAGGKPVPLPSAGMKFDPEWRIYARSAGDDKAPILALAVALDALKAAGTQLRSNIKFFFEGEEESGSAHLDQYLTAHRDLLAGDVWIFCDGPVNQTRRQEIVFGARGVVGMNLTVYGPRRELHSGHYGNWAPNPAMMLAQLLATLKDTKGRVLVEGFYEGITPLSEAEKQAVAASPSVEKLLLQELWLSRSESGQLRLEESINLPSLNIRGLASAAVGPHSRNAVPSEAVASIEVRLVKGMDHATVVERIVQHIRKQGYFVTAGEPDRETRLRHPRVARLAVSGGYNAVRVPLDSPIAGQVVTAVRSAHPDAIVKPTMGGSLPLHVFEKVLGAPVVIVPIANHDNNQHSHNENIRIQNVWDGIETMAALLALSLD